MSSKQHPSQSRFKKYTAKKLQRSYAALNPFYDYLKLGRFMVAQPEYKTLTDKEINQSFELGYN